MNKKINITEKEIDSIAEIFHALGDRKRIRTIVYLMQGMSPVEIAEKLGIPRSSLQVHIEKLIQTYLLERTRTRGENGPYRYNEDLLTALLNLGKRAGEIMSTLERIKKLEDLLTRLKVEEYGIDDYEKLSDSLIERSTKELEELKEAFNKSLEAIL